MAGDVLEQIDELEPEELETLKTLSKFGASTADEVALQMDRPGDDLSPQMDRLVEKGLIESRTISVEDEDFPIYQVEVAVSKALKR
jgi:DNA-binding MarR family transcriptional regulator